MNNKIETFRKYWYSKYNILNTQIDINNKITHNINFDVSYILTGEVYEQINLICNQIIPNL